MEPEEVPARARNPLEDDAEDEDEYDGGGAESLSSSSSSSDGSSSDTGDEPEQALPSLAPWHMPDAEGVADVVAEQLL